MSQAVLDTWQKETHENWKQTFLFRTLIDPKKLYTEDRSDFHPDDKMGVITQAIQIIHLRRGASTPAPSLPSGTIEMLFVMPGAVNEIQREMLGLFGQFIGWLFEVGRDMRQFLDARTLTTQLEATSMVLGQFRHSLRTPIGAISNVVARAQHLGEKPEWIGEIKEALGAINQEIENSKYLIKIPEFTKANILGMLKNIASNSENAATAKN